MTKNKLRTVHVKGVAYKYAIGKGQVRIYKPGTKQILKRIGAAGVSQMGVQPALVRHYIKEHIVGPSSLEKWDMITFKIGDDLLTGAIRGRKGHELNIVLEGEQNGIYKEGDKITALDTELQVLYLRPPWI